ncbi:holocytochrome c synthase [Steccherinum ochraceum]|uniref:Holocytochrome c-type synthase n=1 Tax=Steccherinum ochraceum TaxID=92696 RepID=A0A4R0RNI5_9APHY|nr:holocytochrome c synthase [Steccherinum ochraceum]
MGQSASQTAASAPASCPVSHDQRSKPLDTAPAKCPIDHNSATQPVASSSSSPAKCPIDHNNVPSSSKVAQCPVPHELSSSTINPLNQMPTLSQAPAANQSMDLPLDREESSIPRDNESKWEYPSPQQFYNALVRKGWETPEEHVETMVQIHNFLNEKAWLEILKWEKKENPVEELQLTRFRGRPGEISPKARFWLFAGWMLPSRFNNEPPFDRHDWIVKRKSSGEEVRYVIDYYSAPPEPDGSPVFSLDVRPALDSFGSIKQRIAAATEDAWSSKRENAA